MSDIRKMINPHDEITIDCTDIDAARIAVLVVGHGAYAIEDDAMPFLVFTVDGPEKWFTQTYGMSMSAFVESVSRERVAAAMESMALVGYRTSESDPVGKAHRIAAGIRAKNSPAQGPETDGDE